jgi:hypothetical protein
LYAEQLEAFAETRLVDSLAPDAHEAHSLDPGHLPGRLGRERFGRSGEFAQVQRQGGAIISLPGSSGATERARHVEVLIN